MKTSYTRGRWKVEGALYIYADDELLALTYGPQHSAGERAANAKLMAAAPELAETLYEVSMAIQSMRLSQIAVVVAKALAVLDKAGVQVEIPEYMTVDK